MNKNEILRRFPNACQSFIAANLEPDRPRPVAVMEPHPSPKPLATCKAEEGVSAPILVRVISTRKQLCDSDNLAAKFLIDSLRYCGAIEGDEPEKITVEVSQRKVRKGEEEFTVIQVYEVQP